MPNTTIVASEVTDCTSALSHDPDQQEHLAIFKALVMTVHHFFGGFEQLFAHLTDRRDPLHITYQLKSLMAVGVLMYLLRLGARRQVTHLLRNNHASATKFQLWLGEDECPHGDTLNDAFINLDAEEVQAVVTGMTRTLIRKKCLESERLCDRYYLVAIDGTGMLTFGERHCPHCLTRTHRGHTLYYHPILEAKLVTPSGFVFSLMTEFIENPEEHPDKQDCELNAFYRLAKRLKQHLPRLPICLLLDGLYAGGPTFTVCEQNGWKYFIVLQDQSIPYIESEFAELSTLAPENHLLFEIGESNKILQDMRWVNEITYLDTKGSEHLLGVLECLETKDDRKGIPRTTRFRWVTNLNITPAKIFELANRGGRIRWKIENEGFNVQKNGGYALEHRYSEHPNASKIFYLVLQIAHLLAQLIERGSLFRRAFPFGVGSAKNIAFRLLEAWRNLRLNPQALQEMLDARIQIRFAPP